jgi:CubicO group peptidase (beta-lactamase class C family)
MKMDPFQAATRSFINESLALWHVNGASVVVVKDGETLFCDGVGLRDQENQLPMTADTLMPIASCTKAFTAMTVGMLVDDGKIEWDQPLRTYLPSFRMLDSVASEHMTPRDLLCHRSGLPRHDMVWYCSNFNRRELFDRLRYLEPNSDFRSAYYYQNMMFVVAGLLVEAVAGKSWEAFARERILEPLGMQRSNFSTVLTEQDPDHGTPYMFMKGELQKVPFNQQDGEKAPLGPAGGICSCVTDLGKWLLLQLGGGETGGQRLISANSLAQMHKPHIFEDEPLRQKRFGLDFLSYGLGWSLCSYKGQVLVSHAGHLAGFSSFVAMLPRQNLGIAVLTNGDGYYNSIPETVSLTLFDRLLGFEPTDWNTKEKAFVDSMLAAETLSEGRSGEERKSAGPSHPLDEYLGDYEHPAYGIYSVRREGEQFQLVMNDKICMPLTHYHYDTFEGYYAQFNWHLKLNFSLDEKGSIAGFSAQVEPMVKPISFTKMADRRWSDPASHDRFYGKYELQTSPVMSMDIRSAGKRLVTSMPAGEFELIPCAEMEFRLKDMPGHSIIFQADNQNVIHGALVQEPGMVYRAIRK